MQTFHKQLPHLNILSLIPRPCFSELAGLISLQVTEKSVFKKISIKYRVFTSIFSNSYIS